MDSEKREVVSELHCDYRYYEKTYKSQDPRPTRIITGYWGKVEFNCAIAVVVHLVKNSDVIVVVWHKLG